MTGLFEMRTTRRIELRDRATREREFIFDVKLPPTAVIRKGARVAVLDLFQNGAYVQLADGRKAILDGRLLAIPHPRKEPAS